MVVEPRSSAEITFDDLGRLAEIAAADRTDRFRRRPHWNGYADRILCVALCQGAALHYIDRKNGIKDFDVYTFYAEDPALGPFPPRWRVPVDLGESKFGRHPADEGFAGRRVDLIGRSLRVAPDANPVEAVRAYLRRGRTDTARLLAAKAVVAIDPPHLRGAVVWLE
jgi:hypothetical protein